MEGPERYGSYLVYERIGKGGMATVHRAELQTPRGTKAVALKRLFPTLEREMVEQFLDEARVLRYLQHPNIAATYDSGRVFGTYFIAMEHVQGPTLKQLVEHCGVTVGPVPQPVTLNLAAQLCEALDHAHNQTDENGNPLNIIHRDVTPSNIIINAQTGLLKLFDFGIAKARNSPETAVGIIKGKFAYVAPEYIDGQLDRRADLWAVGILMYELLTSRPLFAGKDAFETIKRVRGFPIPRPSLANPNVTRELDEIVMRALERDPERRWQSAGELRDRIAAVIAQPGNAIDNAGVGAWVTSALGHKRGRAPQLTPMLPMMPPPASLPITMLPAPPAEPAQEPAPAQAAWPATSIVWTACAGALALLLLFSIVWRFV